VKLLFLLLALPVSVFAVVSEPVRLASLEWPPYTGRQLEQQGETAVLVRQVFAAMQQEVQTEFLPWSRAIRASEKTGGLYAGYFPEYQTHNPKFILSDSLGVSELGFVEAKAKPLGQLSVAVLAKFQLGVVQDYVNLTVVDQMIDRGQLTPQLAFSDRQNILKVALGRLDLAVIDRRVLVYLLEHDAEVKRLATDKVQFNASLTELKTLHLALRREPVHLLVIEKFNQHLQKVKSEPLVMPAVSN
jgi:polar amino acid transport system substrate-binding protein